MNTVFSSTHSFKLSHSIMTVVDLLCINIGLETVEKIEEIRAYIKVILYYILIRKFVSRKRKNLWLDRVRQRCNKIWPTWDCKRQRTCLKSYACNWKWWQIHNSWYCQSCWHVAVGVQFILNGFWKYKLFLLDWYRYIDKWPKTGTSTNH